MENPVEFSDDIRKNAELSYAVLCCCRHPNKAEIPTCVGGLFFVTVSSLSSSHTDYTFVRMQILSFSRESISHRLHFVCTNKLTLNCDELLGEKINSLEMVVHSNSVSAFQFRPTANKNMCIHTRNC